MELVYSQPHPNFSSLLPGHTKHVGQWPQQALLPGLWIGVGLLVSQSHFCELGHSKSASLCHNYEQEAQTILLERGFGPSLTGRCFPHLWMRGLLYAFLPMALRLKVVNKIKQDKAKIIVIVRTWPRQPWYSSWFVQLWVFHPFPTFPPKITVDSVPTWEFFASRLG